MSVSSTSPSWLTGGGSRHLTRVACEKEVREFFERVTVDWVTVVTVFSFSLLVVLQTFQAASTTCQCMVSPLGKGSG